MKKIFLSLALILLLLACNRQRRVWLGGLQRTHLADKDQIVRIYADRWGDLYPDASLGINYNDFFDPYSSGNTYKESLDCGSLHEYYTAPYKNTHERKSASLRLKKLSEFYGISRINKPSYNSSEDSAFYYKIQDKITELYADSLRKLLGNNKTLIILIHGFNDTDPTGDFQQMRDSLRSHLTSKANDFIYLEVYWDGLTANQGSPSTARIWADAQQNSAYVGLKVREILNGLSEDTKIRIITHSMGAGVATTALFNTTSKFKSMNPEWYSELNKIRAPVQKDIRLGMLAPAIPGENTFKDFEKRSSGTNIYNNINAVVIGYNKNDYALTKTKRRLLAQRAGATTLGCDFRDREISAVKKILNPLNVKVVDLWFNECNEKKKCEYSIPWYSQHSLIYYMRDDAKLKSFIDSLFNS